MAERFDRIWHNARLATLREGLTGLGIIEHGVMRPAMAVSPLQAAEPISI